MPDPKGTQQTLLTYNEICRGSALFSIILKARIVPPADRTADQGSELNREQTLLYVQVFRELLLGAFKIK